MVAKLKLGILLGLILAGFSFSAQQHSLLPEEILTLVNEERQKAGLSPLSLDDTLNAAASNKATDMVLKRYFAHVSPEGTKPWHWFKRSGYQYVYAGENLASGFTDSAHLVDSWMASDSHRANILSPFYSDLGLAIVKRDNRTLVVEFFGSRDSKLTLSQ